MYCRYRANCHIASKHDYIKAEKRSYRQDHKKLPGIEEKKAYSSCCLRDMGSPLLLLVMATIAAGASAPAASTKGAPPCSVLREVANIHT